MTWINDLTDEQLIEWVESQDINSPITATTLYKVRAIARRFKKVKSDFESLKKYVNEQPAIGGKK